MILYRACWNGGRTAWKENKNFVQAYVTAAKTEKKENVRIEIIDLDNVAIDTFFRIDCIKRVFLSIKKGPFVRPFSFLF